uniref:tRNA (uracil(54)-C(5))-methyltransferase n=1 Tax=Glossina austeni TaxID=7395 RepID=A0A1A9UG99_GLOAU
MEEAIIDGIKKGESLEHQTDVTDVNDEFAYLQRNEFTSEVFKIEVRNLGYFGIGELKKLLRNKLKLDMSKIKSPTHKEFAFVCFRSQADQQKAIKILNGYKWKGKILRAFVAKASADPLQKKRKEENQSEKQAYPVNKKQRTSAEATCPLAGMPYEEQLKQKGSNMEQLIKTFKGELTRINKSASKPLEDFKFEGVEPSPQITGYRNKNEFTVGKNSAGEIVVGFRLGSYADGSVEVSEVDHLPHLPDAAKWAARTFQQLVRHSKYEPFNPETNSGHFRQLTVRTSSQTKEIMLMVGIYSSNLNATDLEEIKSELIKYYDTRSGEESQFTCTSLYYQDVKHREAGQMVSPIEHLFGATHITDNIDNLEFRISPLAFFQINTAAADILYQKVIALAQPQLHSTVLDIYCGIGSIALAFSKHCKRVLGVEIISTAVNDAEYNAQKNRVQNCKFYAGNADDYIQSMVKEVVYDTAPGEELDLIAVVDPPRAGLHNRSIAAIRAASAIKRLVYISCNPERARLNWIELGRPESKQYKGNPFFPKTAIAVDMFPHTTHTELVVLFERQMENLLEENSKKTEGNAVEV